MKSDSHDTTVKKIDSSHSPHGELGQTYLASGKVVSMRLWSGLSPASKRPLKSRREYETVGYVISGRAKLHLEEQIIELKEGDSWLVPKNAEHSYEILEDFSAIEATSPPAHLHDRDSAEETIH
ncbi:MAG: cupin domain-containing protein [Deltaproteobacteria bacterium]|nr:cupin domain-containing protein [Deltaproteobacteria bacterium]